MTMHAIVGSARLPQVIGRYRIDGLLGEGAMAHVYLGHDTQIDRRLAIKVLKPGLRNDPDVVRRFLAESRAAGMLSHPNIVTIHDVGEAEGVPYIAMEYLDGEPLDALLARLGKLAQPHLLALGGQIAAALALAHRSGVIHRDVKPSNILVCDRGATAKLVDFGIARMDDGDEASVERTISRTQFGQVIGTPRYMSPEQAMGVSTDARSDLFSLGAILYEMAVGKPAFTASGLATLAMQIAHQDHPSIDSHVRDCPKGLSFIINKLLAKKPADRFPNAEAVHAAIAREASALQVEAGPVRRGLPVRVKLPLGLAAVSALALVIGVGFVLDRQVRTLNALAIASGSSTTDFIARNVALRVAENADLPPIQQDWLPLQAFIEAAASGGNVKSLAVFDEHGGLRASGGSGKATTVPTVAASGGAISEATASGFRFVRPIRYANADFGRIEMVLGRGELDAALANARALLLAMIAFVMLTVFIAGYVAARQLTQPLRRMRIALDDLADGKNAFRVSHRRRDEFGAVFDAFNRLAAAIEDRAKPSTSGNMDMTRIEPATTAAKGA